MEMGPLQKAIHDTLEETLAESPCALRVLTGIGAANEQIVTDEAIETVARIVENLTAAVEALAFAVDGLLAREEARREDR